MGGLDRDPQSPNPYFEKWSKQQVMKQSKFTHLILRTGGQNNESTLKVKSEDSEVGGGVRKTLDKVQSFTNFFWNIPLRLQFWLMPALRINLCLS